MKAKILKGRVADREDPAEQRPVDRSAPTLAEFADRYMEEPAHSK